MRIVEFRQGLELVPVNADNWCFLSKTNQLGKTAIFFPGSNLVVDEDIEQVRAKLEGNPLVAV